MWPRPNALEGTGDPLKALDKLSRRQRRGRSQTAPIPHLEYFLFLRIRCSASASASALSTVTRGEAQVDPYRFHEHIYANRLVIAAKTLYSLSDPILVDAITCLPIDVDSEHH